MNLKVKAILDPQFEPMALKVREMREKTEQEGQEIVIGVERDRGAVTTYRTRIFPDGTGHDDENYEFVERIVKSMLWVAGGFHIIIAGSPVIAQRIREAYVDKGYRDFDLHFMETVYETTFVVDSVPLECAPKDVSVASPVGRHLDGCRIGFDAGGSDRKVSAVVNGESVYSEEVVWLPKINSDPQYHFDGIYSAIIPRQEVYGEVAVGDRIHARVTKVREDGRLNLSVRDKAHVQMYPDMEKILELLKEYGGVLPFTEKADPEVIRRETGMSKNEFKRAVGHLYKERRIQINDGKIRLVKE